MEKTDRVREEALNILIKVFENKSYSNILIKNIGENFSRLDRAFITELVYGTIKWRMRLDYIIKSLSSIKIEKLKPQILNILRLGLYQIEFMDKVPESAAVNESVKLSKKYGNDGASKYVNAVLRNYLRKRSNIVYPSKDQDFVKYLSVFYSFPEWMVDKLYRDFGRDFTENFLKSSNDVAPVTARINRLKADKNRIKESLMEKGIEINDGLYLDDALLLRGVSGVENLEEYKNGWITIQDESSMLAPIILSPKTGELVMDMCSAPGTKSTYIAELMGNRGMIISGDVHNNKLKLVKSNAERLGIGIINTLCHDASKINEEYVGKADRVLLDVPCSGLGILRKKPEIRWNREIKDFKEIHDLQRSILNASSKYVKLGGVLVYSTCTVLKGENIDMIREFIDDDGRFILEDITSLLPHSLKVETAKEGFVELYPNIHSIDGFFIARLRRVA